MNTITTKDAKRFPEMPFPSDRIPDPLKTFTAALARRYNVPQPELALACLTVAGGVAGTHGRVATESRRHPQPSAVLTLMSAPQHSNLHKAIEHILAPVQARQRTALGIVNKFNPSQVEAEITWAKRRLLALKDSPDCIEILAVRSLLNGLRTCQAPIMLTNSLTRDKLLSSLMHCADGSLFVVGDDSALQCPDGTSAGIDLRLMTTLLKGEMINEQYGRARIMFSEPSLGALLIGNFADFAPLLNCESSLNALAGSIVLLKSHTVNTPATTACVGPVDAQPEWDKQIAGVFLRRLTNYAPELTDRARSRMLAFRDSLVRSLPNIPASTHYLVMSLEPLAYRLCISLHLACCDDRSISEQTAITAIALAKYYGCKQPALWAEVHQNVGHRYHAREESPQGASHQN